MRATVSVEAAAGKKVFVAECAACHSIAADMIIVGPSMDGIAARAGSRVDGLDARTYIYSSILQPADFLVADFKDLMPKTFGKSLTGEELDNLVAYLLTME